MNDINNFRIGYSPLKGWFVEQKEKYFKNIDIVNSNRNFFSYGKMKSETIEVEEWWQFHHQDMPKDDNGNIGYFDTKDKAVKFINDLCAPIKYHYPPDFK